MCVSDNGILCRELKKKQDIQLKEENGNTGARTDVKWDSFVVCELM